MDIIKEKVEMLDKEASNIPQLKALADKAQTKPGYIALAILILVPLIIAVTMGGQIITVVLTVAYPAFKSMKALDTNETDEDDKQWLTYWVIFGVFTIMDEFFWFILDFIPFYFYIKLGFFVWMFAPQFNGATVIYKLILRPVLLKYQDRIEEFIDSIKKGSS